MAEDTKKTQEEIDAEANPDSAFGFRPLDLTGPEFPPMPTEPAKPHTEEEVNKVGQTLGFDYVGLAEGETKEAKEEKKDGK